MDIFEKLALAEESFFSELFLSPVVQEKPIRVHIKGIVVTLGIRPNNFEGWGVFRSDNQRSAQLVRLASMTERQQYLELFPKFALIVTTSGKTTKGIPANQADSRLVIQGQVPILLGEEIRLFDTIDTRFDGENFWYEAPSSFRSPRFSTVLRDLFAKETNPKNLEVPGLTREENIAYFLVYDQEIEAKKDRVEERLRKAVERGGAILRGYIERGNTYTVEISVDGREYRPVVDSETLRATSAGICLSGRDRNFDLQSLVGVYKESNLYW